MAGGGRQGAGSRDRRLGRGRARRRWGEAGGRTGRSGPGPRAPGGPARAATCSGRPRRRAPPPRVRCGRAPRRRRRPRHELRPHGSPPPWPPCPPRPVGRRSASAARGRLRRSAHPRLCRSGRAGPRRGHAPRPPRPPTAVPSPPAPRTWRAAGGRPGSELTVEETAHALDVEALQPTLRVSWRSNTARSPGASAPTGARSSAHSMPAAHRWASATRYGLRMAASPPGRGTGA